MLCKVLLVISLFLCVSVSFSQEKKKENDSLHLKYKKIEELSKKSTLTKQLHRLIFKSTSTRYSRQKKTTTTDPSYELYEGKVIRTITIQTLDPFGFSETDSTRRPQHFAGKAGNVLHIKTKKFAIRNTLLMKENQRFDSIKVKETERLIRSQRFVRRVAIQTQYVSESSDSVDVHITVLDSWSLIPNASITPSKAGYELLERNFIGTGHSWDNRYQHDLEDKRRAFSTRYIIPNIKNTYIQTTLNYQMDLNKDYIKYIDIERNFFSPLTRWAGGLLLEKRFLKDSLTDSSGIYAQQTFKYGTIDAWGGHSFPLFDATTKNNDQVTNLLTTLRYYKINYERSISQDYDPYDFYTNEAFWLTGIGISSRKFVKDEYIFNYGIIEDVPIGKYYGITAGIQEKNSNSRMYVGARATLGDYFKWGYFSTNYEYGTFFNDGKNEQSAFLAELYYFSPLMEPGKWKIRQFFKGNLVIGGHRLDIKGDQLTINEENGIIGFNDSKLFGDKKMVFAFQTQTYSPWEWAGFRFNPFFNYTLAFIGNTENGFTKSEGYSKIGLGVLLSNDYLVFSTFQFSFAFYPKIPNEGTNIIRTNNFSTSDFGYLEFEVNEPRTVRYN